MLLIAKLVTVPVSSVVLVVSVVYSFSPDGIPSTSMVYSSFLPALYSASSVHSVFHSLEASRVILSPTASLESPLTVASCTVTESGRFPSRSFASSQVIAVLTVTVRTSCL